MGNQQFPLFIVTMIRIVEGDLVRIVKTTSGLFKSDAVFSHIGSGFISVPLEGDQFNLISSSPPNPPPLNACSV